MTQETSPPRSLVRLARRPAPRTPASLLAVAGVVAVLALVPLVYLVVRAIEGGPDALGPLLRPRTVELVVSTASLGLAVAGGAILLGVPLAWLTVRSDLPGRQLWSVLAIAPLAVPSYLLAFAYVGALAPRGWMSEVLAPLGFQGPGIHGFGGAVLVLTLATLPYVVISTRAALMRLDPAIEEAARSLGDGPWSAARTAVVPVIVPAVGAGALLAGLYAVSDFGAVTILRYDTLATAIYSQYRFSFDRSAAAALAVALLVLALGLVWIEARVRRRAALRAPHGRRRVTRPVTLGAWRWPAIALAASVAALSLGVPLVTVGSWLGNGLARGLDLSRIVGPIADSLVLAVGSAILALALAMPLARLVVRFPGSAASAVERLLYVVYAVPAISFALAVVSLTLSVLPVLYQTLVVLIAAVALRYLVQGVGALRGPLLQLSPRTQEAARSLGEPQLGVWRSITLPLLRPGIAAAGLLVLLSALKELPLTLLLAPPGFSTLATSLWDASREAVFSQAAVPAALLLAISLLSVAVLVRRGTAEA